MHYKLIIQLINYWREVIILLLIITSLLLASLHNNKINEIKNLKLEHQSYIQKYELEKEKQIQNLKEQIRLKENAFIQKQEEYNEKAKIKQFEINRINDELSNANDSLSDLTTKVARTNSYKCPTINTTTQAEPIIIEVPTTNRSAELTAKMANEFAELSQQCATKYEQLKTETIRLNEWSTEVYDLSNVPIEVTDRE